MGDWSRRVGTVFLDWLALPSGLKWIDVGCGNGAFTELIVERCAPNEVRGIDPSEAQLDFARKRPAARLAKFDHGDAMALPFPADTFDVAIMALVIFFVPDPAKGCRGDDAGGASGRHGCGLCLGHIGRRFHIGAAPH